MTMANADNFVAKLTSKNESMIRLLLIWANDRLPEESQASLDRFDADRGFMGLIPNLLDSSVTQLDADLAPRAFCDGGHAYKEDDLCVVELYFHAPDFCDELWTNLWNRYPEIVSISVYADPDDEDAIDEWGEDDLVTLHR